MTVVKVQKPLAGVPLWLVYDKFKARQCFFELSEIPRSVLVCFESAPEGSIGRLKQYFDGANWIMDKQLWDLSQVTPVTRRLIW